MTTTTRPVTKPSLTLEEFLALPETEPASEYVCGEVFRKPMPTDIHTDLQYFLTTLLKDYLRRHPLGTARMEWRCLFPGRRRALIPDVSYVSAERWPLGHRVPDGYLHGVPDLAIEVLSPKQNTQRLLDKITAYLAHGVRLIWIVDPKGQTIMVIRPGEESVTLRPGDTLDGGDVLPGFSAAVGDIFAQIDS